VRRQDLLLAAGFKDNYGSYARHVLPLMRDGLLAFTLPDAPRSKNQRYVLTDAGRSALSAAMGQRGRA
jgi:hypothetical protein